MSSVCFYGDVTRGPKTVDNPLQVRLRRRSRHHRIGELQSHEQLALDRATAQLEQTPARRLARTVVHGLQRQIANLRHPRICDQQAASADVMRCDKQNPAIPRAEGRAHRYSTEN